MFKNFSSVLLLSIMILGIGIPKFAQAINVKAENNNYQIISQEIETDNIEQFAISQEKALEILKNIFPALTKDKNFELNHNYYYDDAPAWHFLWRNSEYQPAANTTSRITATINAQTGELTQFYYHPDPLAYKGKNATISRDEAFRIAEEFLHKMHPDKADILNFADDYNLFSPDLKTSYGFHWDRVADGIPVGGDGITIKVDAVSGLIREYNYQWHDCKIPQVNNILPQDELVDKLLNEVGMYPAYKKAPEAFGSDVYAQFIPLYMLNTEVQIFDAQTGQPLNQDGNVIAVEDIRTYNKNFHSLKEDSNIEKLPISYQNAVEKAQKMIEKTNPEKSNLVVLHNDISYDQMINSFWLKFDRLVNGIPCSYEGIQVEVDKQNGDISNYSVDWNSGNFIPLTNLITVDKAKEIIKAEPPLELAYIVSSNENCQTDNTAVLAYRISSFDRVAAFSGKRIGYYGEEKNNYVLSNDFAGHWAAPSLYLLKQSGLLPDDNFNPNKEVSRLEAVKILTSAININTYYLDEKDIELNFEDINAYDPDYAVILKAVKRGFIDNNGKFAPDQKLTREELAVWLVNCLGYQEIASIKHEIELPFKDADTISADKKNFVGLANGLGFLTSDKYGSFRPQAACTWAEIATVAIRLVPQFE